MGSAASAQGDCLKPPPAPKTAQRSHRVTSLDVEQLLQPKRGVQRSQRVTSYDIGDMDAIGQTLASDDDEACSTIYGSE